MLVFSVINEAIIEYLFGNVKLLMPYLPLISLAVGILLTFIYQLDVFALVLGSQSASPFLDFLLSGFLISRISNFINDLAQKIFDSK